ncbi:MAG TPA: hypothetical protein VEV82_10720, partial [Actinomycetota bacterium]|nr:hypothetical protein [Actinomycetota bacterium]
TASPARAIRIGETIEEYRPERRSDVVDYDAGTALIVVDVQNDFADPKGICTCRAGKRSSPSSIARSTGR